VSNARRVRQRVRTARCVLFQMSLPVKPVFFVPPSTVGNSPTEGRMETLKSCTIRVGASCKNMRDKNRFVRRSKNRLIINCAISYFYSFVTGSLCKD